MAVVGTVMADISGSVVGNFTSLSAVATVSDTGAEPLLLTDTDSSSIGVYIKIIK